MTRLREVFSLAVKGFCMGTADLIPGVSGGTMAFILGIYERLLKAIKSFDMIWLAALVRLDTRTILSRPHFTFLIPLLAGIGLALIFFTRVVPLPRYIYTHPEQIYGLFFGLILASIYILLKEIGRITLLESALLIAGMVGGFIVVNLVPVDTPTEAWFIFLCGATAICAMVLPGISGSFILLILRKYAYIIDALGALNFAVLLPFVLGMITGLAVFTRFLVWLLQRAYRQVLLVIKGILVASLWVLWPWQDRVYVTVRGKERLLSTNPVLPQSFDTGLLWSVGFMLAGLVLVLIIHRIAERGHSQESC